MTCVRVRLFGHGLTNHQLPDATRVVRSDGVWTSADAGVTWTRRTTGNGTDDWIAVASDATGTRLVAASTGAGGSEAGNIWRSADSGATWTNQTAGTSAENQAWAAVTSDASGAHLVAVPRDGDIWANDNTVP